MKKTASVIIPAYNAERFLPATVESILSQTLTDWELVIVTNGSTDSTRQMAQAYAARDARVRVISQENQGSSRARNRGFAESDPQTPYVLFTDSDDLLEPDALARLVDAAEADPASVGAHGLGNVIGVGDERPEEAEEFERLCRERPIPTPDGLLGVLPSDAPTIFESFAVYNSILTTAAVVLKRSALGKEGPFDPETLPADDWDLWLRLTGHGGHLAFVNAVTMSYRRHPGNFSRQKRRMRNGGDFVRSKALADPTFTDAQREALRRGYTAFLRNYRAKCMDAGATKWGYARGYLHRRDLRGATLEAIRAAQCVYLAAVGTR
jgi:glycosyltransferase involved in cell wall biosynthesis